MEIKIKKSVFKEVIRLPQKIQNLYWQFVKDLQQDGLRIAGWELKKMSGNSNEYRAKLNQNYRVIMEYVKPGIIIIKVASREGVYK